MRVYDTATLTRYGICRMAVADPHFRTQEFEAEGYDLAQGPRPDRGGIYGDPDYERDRYFEIWGRDAWYSDSDDESEWDRYIASRVEETTDALLKEECMTRITFTRTHKETLDLMREFDASVNAEVQEWVRRCRGIVRGTQREKSIPDKTRNYGRRGRTKHLRCRREQIFVTA
jgi:hypothetical protein